MTAPPRDQLPTRVKEIFAEASRPSVHTEAPRRSVFAGGLLAKSSMTAIVILLAIAQTVILLGGSAHAQCTEEGPVGNFTGSLRVGCPCFVPGEQAGAGFTLPSSKYPLEILTVGIEWASQFGGTPASLEQAIHIYQGGLPNPGTPIFTLPGPVMNDGFINEFDIELIPGNKVINSGPFTVTLEFLNQNANDPFAPSVLHDNNGCQSGKNVVYAIPGGWFDACLLGVSGDWVFYVKYKTLKALASANPSPMTFTSVPAYETTCDSIFVVNDGCDDLTIDGIGGCTDSPFSLDTTMTAHTIPPGDSTKIVVCVTPTTPGPHMCTITVVSDAANSPTTIPVTVQEVSSVDHPVISHEVEFVSVVPNPFNPSTTVRFWLPEALSVNAAVYSVDGKQVRTLARNRLFGAGEQTLDWNGRNDQGHPLASGVYLVRISTPLGDRVTRAVLLK